MCKVGGAMDILFGKTEFAARAPDGPPCIRPRARARARGRACVRACVCECVCVFVLFLLVPCCTGSGKLLSSHSFCSFFPGRLSFFFPPSLFLLFDEPSYSHKLAASVVVVVVVVVLSTPLSPAHTGMLV